MKLGLLVCDHVREQYLGISGDYQDMFSRMFEPHPEVELVVYDAVNGEMPSSTSECDAWMTTGSRHSVNDDLDWIRRLEGFVREVAADGVPFVGICFGHQLIARALGGTVTRSDRGWGVGLQPVELAGEAGWTGAFPRFQVQNMHQDQVETLPPGAEVLGWSDNCPVSVLGVGDNILGIQGHPEMDARYVEAILRDRRGNVIPAGTADMGLESLEGQGDSAEVADWVLGFLQRARTTR